MSLKEWHNIECNCGNSIEFELWRSVNIQVDPQVRKRLLKHEINLFECKKCGHKQELVAPFLYHDMDYGLMVMVLSERYKSISAKLFPSGLFLPILKKLNIRQYTVYGFDELLHVIKLFKPEFLN